MKALLLLAVLMGGAAHAAAETVSPAEVSQDPLMRQIRRRMMQSDGGVSAVTWVQGANGEKIAIPLAGSEAALRPLVPAPGLVPVEAPAKPEKIKPADKQLKHIEQKKTWR